MEKSPGLDFNPAVCLEKLLLQLELGPALTILILKKNCVLACMRACPGMQGRSEQLTGIGSFPPPWRFWGSNTVREAWQQVLIL